MLIITGYWGYGQYKDRQRVETLLGNRFQQSFYEMIDNVEQIQILLGKALVSTSPGQNILTFSDIWKYAMNAQAELNKLPVSEKILMRTAKFLSQTGDYAHVLARKNAEGKVLSAKNRELLKDLREQAAKLSISLHELESEVLDGKINWTEIARGTRYQLSKDKPATLADDFTDIQEEMTKYPTLIYDGPFSDHIAEMKPKELKGEKITREEGEKKAKEVIDIVNSNELKTEDSRTVDANIPAFNYQISAADDRNYSVDISQKGGYLINMIFNRNISKIKLDLKEASEKAREYLAAKGYPNMHPTYAEIKDSIAYISCAYKKDNIIFYPDIIDIQVAMDNGQVLAVEALSYLTSHHERELKEPRITEKEAKQLVEERFEDIESIKLAVIPTDSLKEVLTYEIRGKIGGEIYLVYINAETGNEEQILRLIKSETGTFTM